MCSYTKISQFCISSCTFFVFLKLFFKMLPLFQAKIVHILIYLQIYLTYRSRYIFLKLVFSHYFECSFSFMPTHVSNTTSALYSDHLIFLRVNMPHVILLIGIYIKSSAYMKSASVKKMCSKEARYYKLINKIKYSDIHYVHCKLQHCH